MTSGRAVAELFLGPRAVPYQARWGSQNLRGNSLTKPLKPAVGLLLLAVPRTAVMLCAGSTRSLPCVRGCALTVGPNSPNSAHTAGE